MGGGRSALFEVDGHSALAEIGRGAAGIVYRARQEHPSREVAMKVMRPHEAGSADSKARFRLEAVTVAGLDHPGILPVFGVGEYDGLPYFTMKLCAGGSLADRVERYRGQWREIALLMVTLAEAVQHAHARGVLHRDLKPGNILFDEAGRAFVSDFGIAKSSWDQLGGGNRVTRALEVMGTLGYVAPEVLRDGATAATSTSDVYALGVILHELLAGAAAEGDGRRERSTLPADVPRDLAVIVATCTRAEPTARYGSAAALANDLRCWHGFPVWVHN
jgi:serine/threonine protein kinase